MSCADEDCPGCIVQRVLDELEEQGFDPEDMIHLFFDAMNERYQDRLILGVVKEELEVTVH